MNNESMSFGLILSVFLLLCLNWIYFFNWLGLIGWIVSVIAPTKKVKEIEDERLFRKTKVFKKHQRKWKLRFFIAPVSFAVIYLVLSYITKHIIVSYFGSMFIIIAVYRMLVKYETKERKELGM